MLLEERVFSPPSKVTVGESSRANFVLQSPELGKRHVLFEHTNSGTTLVLKPGILGKVRLSGQTREAEELINGDGYNERRGDCVLLPLTAGDGGVLVFGRTGLMFQFVQDLGKVERAKLAQITGTDGYMNRLFGLVLGVVLLFAFVSRLFASAPGTFTVEQLPDRIVSYVIDDPEAARDFQQEMDRRREEAKKEKEQKDKEPQQPDPKKVEHTKKIVKEDTEDLETAKIKEKVANKGVMGAIQIAKQKDGALKKVLAEGGLDISLNSAISALNRGNATARVITSEGPGGLGVPGLVGRSGIPEPLGDGARDAAPATGQTGRHSASRLAEHHETQVVVTMPESGAQVTGGTLDRKDIFDVVMKNKNAIRYCYESQLMRFPTLRGQVLVDFIIELNGTVQTVKVPNNGLSQPEAREAVSSCLIKFIKRWEFPKPRGGKVRVIYPFTFGRAQ